jgi:hypothetical protein
MSTDSNTPSDFDARRAGTYATAYALQRGSLTPEHCRALREAFLAGCRHHRENGGYIVPTVEEVTASPYAIELDETTAQVLICPECSSTSVGFSSSHFGVTARKEIRGNIVADTIALGFCCEDCGEQWELQAEACTGQRGQALSLTLEIIPKAPCIFPTFVTPSTPTRTLTGLFKRFFGKSKAT